MCKPMGLTIKKWPEVRQMKASVVRRSLQEEEWSGNMNPWNIHGDVHFSCQDDCLDLLCE